MFGGGGPEVTGATQLWGVAGGVGGRGGVDGVGELLVELLLVLVDVGERGCALETSSQQLRGWHWGA